MKHGGVLAVACATSSRLLLVFRTVNLVAVYKALLDSDATLLDTLEVVVELAGGKFGVSWLVCLSLTHNLISLLKDSLSEASPSFRPHFAQAVDIVLRAALLLLNLPRSVKSVML